MFVAGAAIRHLPHLAELPATCIRTIYGGDGASTFRVDESNDDLTTSG
jgi:hypothetical protein